MHRENESPRPRWKRPIAFLAALLLIAAAFAFGLRFMDGPLFVLHGGPLRSGEWIDYASVDWESLDRFRELELEISSTGRSLLLWFSVTDGRPYIACGFDCEDGVLERWPNAIASDPRVVLRLDGRRVRARVERVTQDTDEHAAAQAERRAKFHGPGGLRANAELEAHDAIIEVGSRLTGADRGETASDAGDTPSGRLFRIVAP